jgi:hypothetical protein
MANSLCLPICEVAGGEDSLRPNPRSAHDRKNSGKE